MNLLVGDCKPSEVKAFTADYLDKVLEPRDWLALWSTHGFSVVVEVSVVAFRNGEKMWVAGCTDVRKQSYPKKEMQITTVLSSVIWFLGLCVEDVLPRTAN